MDIFLINIFDYIIMTAKELTKLLNLNNEVRNSRIRIIELREQLNEGIRRKEDCRDICQEIQRETKKHGIAQIELKNFTFQRPKQKHK